jgi:hypothetical protein
LLITQKRGMAILFLLSAPSDATTTTTGAREDDDGRE